VSFLDDVKAILHRLAGRDGELHNDIDKLAADEKDTAVNDVATDVTGKEESTDAPQ
jgi:hypothetical protein